MKIKEIQAKSILVKSGLSGVDFVINPYTGCSHSCIYCYARFMKRFTNHEESWGEFVDIKINAPDLVSKKCQNKVVLLGSVTDAYQAIEKKYEITRKILKRLIPFQPKIEVLTKSDLVLRDVDLLKQFKNCLVSLSMSTSDEKISRKLEAFAPGPNKRVQALKEIYNSGIKTIAFISPIFPYITDWKEIVNKTKGFVNEYWFENLNFYPSVRKNIYDFLQGFNPDLTEKYKEIYFKKNNHWDKEEKEIKGFCEDKKIGYKIYFHHGK